MAILPIPYERFELHSPLPPTRAIERLAASLERDWRRRWFGGSDQPFAGDIDGDTFSIRRMIRYHNSFLPCIEGRVVPAPLGGSMIVGTMTLHPLVIAFLVLVCLLVLLASIFAGWHHPFERIIAPTLVIGFCYIVTTAGFAFDAGKARRLLVEVFEAKTTPDLPDALDA